MQKNNKKKENIKIKNQEIIISRMFTGSYLDYNIGHEAINLFQADDGCHYIYLNPWGDFDKSHIDKTTGKLSFDSILLVKPIGNNAVEVVALAKGLEMIYNPTLKKENIKIQQEKSSKISYASVSIAKIYDDAEYQDINITFKAKKVLNPTKSICIQFASKGETMAKHKIKYTVDYEKVVSLRTTKLGQSPKNYILERDSKEDYNNIKNIINDKNLWKDGRFNVKLDKIPTIKHPIYLEICNRSYDEIAYSNMIHYFLNNYPKFQRDFIEFLKEKDSSVVSTEKFEIYREYHAKSQDEKGKSPIDLLIKYGEQRIIIENKLKAEVGAIKTDINGGNQLTRYVQELKEIEKINERSIHCFLLTPNYHKINIENLIENKAFQNILKKYKQITYKDLYEFFSERKRLINKDNYYDEFLKSLEIHTTTTDDINYRTMMRRLMNRINLRKNNPKK